MKRVFKVFTYFIVAIILYYFLYFVLFTIKIKNQPLITYLQKEIILDKDLVVKTFEDLNSSKKYDFIVLGSSHAYRSFNPKEFEKKGVSFYNLGSSSQAPVNSFCILKKYIEHADNFILEVYPVGFNLTGKESFMVLANINNNYDLLTDMAFEMSDLRAFNLITIKPFINNELRKRPYNYYNCDYFYKGFALNTDSVKSIKKSEIITLNFSMIYKQFGYLKKMIELCKSRHKKITFIYAPIPSYLNIQGQDRFLNMIAKFTKRNSCNFLDFHTLNSLNDRTDFYDNNHLNSNGVNKFNTILIKSLIKR